MIKKLFSLISGKKSKAALSEVAERNLTASRERRKQIEENELEELRKIDIEKNLSNFKGRSKSERRETSDRRETPLEIDFKDRRSGEDRRHGCDRRAEMTVINEVGYEARSRARRASASKQLKENAAFLLGDSIDDEPKKTSTDDAISEEFDGAAEGNKCE